MPDSYVRLTDISIKNFKNIKEGKLSFINRRKNYRSSILGLYGQNGSGKTALIDAIQVLKYALCGKAVPSEAADYIHVEADHAELQYAFSVEVPSSGSKYQATYEFKLRKEEYAADQNLAPADSEGVKYKAVIYDEVLSYSFESGKCKVRKSAMIDTRTEDVFVPVAKFDRLIGKNKDTSINLLIAKKLALQTSRSFVFSRELLKAVKDKNSQEKDDEEYVRHSILLERMIWYGNWELFVISTSNTGIISLNALPLAFMVEDMEMMKRASGMMVLPLEWSAVIPKDEVSLAHKVIGNMNIVLRQLVPDLTIGIKELGFQTLQNGKDGISIRLASYKNRKEIPLKYESEGIKKIISILQLLVVVYNRSNITIAIDELDAGVFEYLLGEVLRIVSEKGKGQLIFTSHNLRPLETIDRGFIAFTTTNPSKRYVRMSNIKDNNNLRDLYYRDIVLGGQGEELYDFTNNAEIALAFREAGEQIGPRE